MHTQPLQTVFPPWNALKVLLNRLCTAQWKINSVPWSNLICITCNRSAEVCCASHSLSHLATDSDWGHLVWEVQGFWELQNLLSPGAKLALDTAVLSLQSICLLLEGPERHACGSEAAPGPCTLPLSSWWTHPLENATAAPLHSQLCSDLQFLLNQLSEVAIKLPCLWLKALQHTITFTNKLYPSQIQSHACYMPAMLYLNGLQQCIWLPPGLFSAVWYTHIWEV